MRLVLCVLTLAVLHAGSAAFATANEAVKPSLIETAASDLHTAFPGYEVTIVDPLTLKLGPHGQEPFEVHLDRIAAFCSANPDQCDAALHAFTSKMIEAIKAQDAPLKAEMLRAVVRPVGYVDGIRRLIAERKQNVDLIATPLAGELYALCYFDLPTTMRPMMSSDLASLSLTQETALKRCSDNVRAVLPPLDSQLKDVPDQAFAILRQKDYGSSYFLFPADWAGLAAKLDGRLIVAVPDSETMLYGKDDGEVAVDALFRLAGEATQRSERPISAKVFRWTPTGWQPVSK